MTRTGLTASLIAAGFSALSLFAPPVGAETPHLGDPGEVLLVTTNLKEAFDPVDVQDRDDMRQYVRRLMKQVPRVPDVLMIQEVRRSSARVVAQFLTEATANRFVVAVRPGEPPWVEKDDRIIDRESAIVINTNTMVVAGDTGTIRTTYPRSAANPSERIRVRNHTFATVARKDGSATISLASVHYVQNDFLRSDAVGDDYKRRWVLRTADVLAAEAAEFGSDMTAIGGDYNASRGTRDEFANHSHSPWLLGITAPDYGYFDSVYEVTKEGGPDFIMATGTLVDAGLDLYYDTRTAEEQGYFYSDHRFRWAVLSAGDQAATQA